MQPHMSLLKQTES